MLSLRIMRMMESIMDTSNVYKPKATDTIVCIRWEAAVREGKDTLPHCAADHARVADIGRTFRFAIASGLTT
jgi:hypothetical protein